MKRMALGRIPPALWALLNRMVTLVWVSALTLLMLVALYVGLGRQFMAHLHHFEPEIETALTGAFGRPVEISGLSGQWQGVDPVVRVADLRIGRKNQADASLGQLRIRLDSWASLLRWRLVFREFRASGSEATLDQKPDGRFAVAGVWEPAGDSEAVQAVANPASGALEALDERLGACIEWLGQLLSDPVVSVTDVRLRVEPADGDPIQLRIPAMDVRFEDGLFSASGRLLGAGDGKGRIGAFALQGRHLLSSGLTGDLFLDLEAAGTFSELFMPYKWRDLAIDALQARGEAWLQFRGGRPQQARMKLQLPELGLRSAQGAVTPLNDLSLDLLWQRTNKGWLLQARGSSFRWGQRQAGAFAGRVVRNSDGVKALARDLDLGLMSALVRHSGVLNAEDQRRLAEHDPTGLMERVSLTLPKEGTWRLRGRFSEVTAQAAGGAPSTSDLDGYVETGPREGWISLEPGPVRFGFPELFHTDWGFERGTGQIQWTRRGDGWRVMSRHLAGRHEGVDITGGFRLRLRENSADTLSLRVGIAGAKAGMLGRLVPKYRVPPELYSFLTESIHSGTVPWAWYYGHGEIGDEVSAEGRVFTSSVAYRFQDMRLTYDPDWPALEDAAGKVRVQDDEGLIQLDQGTVGGVALKPSQIRVADGQKGPRVDVNTGARRNGALLTDQWRQSSPFGKLVGDWVKKLQVKGSSDLDLALSLWPDQERDPEVEAQLKLADTRVRFAPGGIEWRGVTGPIRFTTDTGFDSTDLEARFMGEPVALEVRDGPERDPVFRQKGKLSVAQLEQWLGRSLPRTSGRLSYSAALRPTQGPSLGLEADLSKLVLDWPAPLNKAAGDAHSLSAQVEFGERDGTVRIRGSWQPLGALRLVLRDGVLERGRIGLGVRHTNLPEQPVLSITGNLPGVALHQWWQAMADMPAPEVTRAGDREPGRGPGRRFFPDLSLELGIGEPRLNDWVLSPLQVQAEAHAWDDWQVTLDSDWVSGSLGLDDAGVVSVDLDHLVLPGMGSEDERPMAQLDSATLAQGARQWPEASVRIGRLAVGDRRIDHLEFQLVPDGSDIRVESLALNMEDLALKGSLTWQPAVTDGVTEFSGTVEGSDLKGLEAVVGQTSVPITSKRVEASLNMAWPGVPTDFSLSELRAAMDFRFEDGIIDQEIEGAGVFRVFGLLNTDTLWRRLQLDFSDVYESGIPFDHIEGEALIHEGRLIFDPTVVIQAPSGGFRMSGEADLIRESLDMSLVVVLPVTQNLPLAAVLFGYAPPVGGALFVIDKVFGGILSRVTSATYRVKGSWNEPEIELRNLFDTESDLESYERPKVGVEAPERPAGEIRR
ncbi:YhdP family protein [Halomonadaceae bacterium KBTZ08]